MSVPYNDETKESYIERMKNNYMEIAKGQCERGNDLSMWQALFTWAQCEELYGGHWDKLKEKNT